MDAGGMADGRPCRRRNCSAPVTVLAVVAETDLAWEECVRGHRQ